MKCCVIYFPQQAFYFITLYFPVQIIFMFFLTTGARGGLVGSGTALQAGRSRVWFLVVSLGCFIDIILPAAL
jgi:hypothetical protein